MMTTYTRTREHKGQKTATSLRLGFYYHIPVFQDSTGLHVPGFFGRFLDSLAEHSNQLTCFLHQAVSPASQALCDYTLHASNIYWVDMGPPRSALVCSFFPYSILDRFKPHCKNLDILLIRGPSPLLPALARASQDLPTSLLLVGDYLAGSANSTQPVWRKTFIRLWAKWYTNQQVQVAQHSLTLVNSRRLYRQLEGLVPTLIETRTTTLEKDDFYPRDDTCQHRPVRLLYTGRYSTSKGLFDIVEALALLVNRGENISLDLVGWPEKGEENIVEKLLAFADEKGISGKVHNHGYQPVGPELFAFYQRADIYLIASRSSFEGFPRTIWEAMAHSLPVIATRVGSIPDYIDGAAELVQPGQVEQLAQAVEEIINNAQLRQTYIQRGMALAKSNTMDVRVKEMSDTIQSWLASP